MGIDINRIFLYVDATIGNDFIYNEKVGESLLSLREAMFHEVIIIKNTQASHVARRMSDLFTIKEYPRSSIKKAMRHSKAIIYVTDGQNRIRKHRIRTRMDNQKGKIKIKIRL